MPFVPVRALGDSVELGAGLDRIRGEFEVPARFSAEVERAGAEAARRGAGHESGYVDARDIPFVTIDPPGSRDLDQAYFAERRGGGIRLRYAIADVGRFVALGDAVDVEAHARGVTQYLPDARAPLYPEVLGEGVASLLPGVERPALLWTVDLDDQGDAATWRLERALVRSRRALSYAEVQAAIDGGDADGAFVLLREIGIARRNQEKARGGVSLAVPAQEVTPVDGGYELSFDTPLPVEEWNAQVSLLAGMCAAVSMIEAGVGILRTLPAPGPEVLNRLRRSALALGIAWPEGRTYAEVVRELDPRPACHAAFLTQAVRTLRGAGYELVDPTRPPPTHSALAAPYAHVTAPLRRLADRFANEIVLAHTCGHRIPAWVHDALPALPDLMEDALRRSAGVERAVVDLAECLVLRARVGEVLTGTVIDVGGETATVQIANPAVVCALDTRGVSLGDRVSVRLVEVHPVERRVVFEQA